MAEPTRPSVALVCQPARGMPQMRPKPAATNLSQARQRVGLSQEDLARLAGVSRDTLQRIEWGQHQNPPIRYLANFALVLGVPLEEVCEPEWLGWTKFPKCGSKPPSRELIRQLSANEHNKIAETRSR